MGWCADMVVDDCEGLQFGLALRGLVHRPNLSHQKIGALLNGFDEQLSALDADIAHALAQTAVQLARQVLRAELKVQPEVVAQVRAALATTAA